MQKKSASTLPQCKNNKHQHYHTAKTIRIFKTPQTHKKCKKCVVLHHRQLTYMFYTPQTHRNGLKRFFLLIDILGICKDWARLPDVRSVVLHHRHTAPPVSF